MIFLLKNVNKAANNHVQLKRTSIKTFPGTASTDVLSSQRYVDKNSLQSTFRLVWQADAQEQKSH